jgi:2',3'-cyclic-nucleotide 2'-phosphodiesterase (5'-nucleotidase family)
LGGLSKKAFQIETFRKQQTPLLVVDSGNLLFKRRTLPKVESQEKITARGIIEAYHKMKYDAVAVGPLDLSAGIDLLKNSGKQELPWISANLLNVDNTPVFPPFIINNIGGLQIGLVGLTHTTSALPPNLHLADWQAVLPQLLQTLSKKCDHIVLLSNLANTENYLIAKDYPEIDMIITADPRYGNLSPVINNKTLITQTASQGKYLGDLTISWGNTGEWATGHDNQVEILQYRLTATDRQIQRLQDQKEAFSPSIDRQLEQLRKSRQSIAAQLSAEQEKAGKRKEGSVSSSFSASFLALTSSLPDNPEVEQIIENINSNIRKLNRRNRQRILGNEKNPAPAKQPAVSFTGYKRCETCHQRQADFWTNTGHARAYTSLVKIGQNNNLECLPCHVTHWEDLFAKAPVDATSLLSLPPSMQTVGCEVCHGAGSGHANNPEKIQPIRRPGQRICLYCHTEQRDPGFDYEKKIKLIQCPAD